MNRNIIITGASSGLGRATAIRLAADGYTVFATARRQNDLRSLADLSDRIIPIQLNLTQQQDFSGAFEDIQARAGADGIYALINMAGFSYFSPIEYFSMERAREMFEVNYFAPVRLSQLFLPLLERYSQRNTTRSRIINILSWAAVSAGPWNSHYYGSKAALLMFSESQHYEFNTIGVDTVAVLPGMMKTPFLDKSSVEIDRGLRDLPPQGNARYGTYLRRMGAMAQGSASNPIVSDPETIATKLAAITGRNHPKFRYYLGTDAKVVGWMSRYIPFALRSMMLRRAFGVSAP